MTLPPRKLRDQVIRLLRAFFTTHKKKDFNEAIRLLSRYYEIRRPHVEWFEYIDNNRIIGRTHENGLVHLVHPENWKRNKKYNTEDQWVNAVLHEFGHVLYYSDCERKADLFAERMGVPWRS